MLETAKIIAIFGQIFSTRAWHVIPAQEVKSNPRSRHYNLHLPCSERNVSSKARNRRRHRHILGAVDIQITRQKYLSFPSPSLHSSIVSLSPSRLLVRLCSPVLSPAGSDRLRRSFARPKDDRTREYKAYPYSQSVNRLPPGYTVHIANQALLCKYGKGC